MTDFDPNSQPVPAPPAPPAPAPPAPAAEQVGYAPAPPAAPAAAGVPTAAELGAAASAQTPFKPIIPAPWMAPYLGSNGLPAGVPSFNWGAFFFGWIWSFVYGLNTWGAIALAVSFGGNLVSGVVGAPLSGLISLAQLGFAIYLGLTINKAYWAVNPKQLTVEEFNQKQKKWIIFGIALIAVGIVLFFLVIALAGFAAFVGALNN